MASDTLKTTISRNIRTLLDIDGNDAGIAKLMALGFANGTATRLLDDTTQIRTETIERLARSLNVEAWMLCVPNLDATRLPTLSPPEFRWPFRRIDPDVLTGLVGTTAAAVENGLLSVLATAGVSPRKLGKTGT